jgi:hypothetical protein
MNTIRLLIPAFMLLILLVIPVIASADNLPQTQQITIKSEYTGNAVVNEVTDLKWSTGTPGNMTTYTWRQAANLDKPGQTSVTQLDIKRTNQSTTWQLKRNGVIVPGGVTVDNSPIIRPEDLLSSFQSSFPLFQPQEGLIYTPFTLPPQFSPFRYF